MLRAVFWALVGTFAVIVSEIFVPGVMELLQGPLLFLLPFAIFFLLGTALLVLTLRQKVEGKLRRFLILTGGSAAGFFVGVLLHNFLYGAAVLTKEIIVLHYLFEFLHVAFFLIATLVCPLAFVIGVIGSIVHFRKQPSKVLTK